MREAVEVALVALVKMDLLDPLHPLVTVIILVDMVALVFNYRQHLEIQRPVLEHQDQEADVSG
jgi:hypothetical protein